MRHLTYKLYETREASFKQMVANIFDACRPVGIPVRWVLFGAPKDNDSYVEQRDIAREEVLRRFGTEAPVFSYVAQAPCGVGLTLEVHEVVLEETEQIHYKKSGDTCYITVESPQAKRLFVGGVQGDVSGNDFQQQAEEVFAKLGALMRQEQLLLESIVRQWNYIERITDTETSGRQRYQIFNDARSRFYRQSTWENGYPAATGIGTQAGGVLVGLDAVYPAGKGSETKIIRVDNPLQVAAHRYSQQVLIGNKDSLLAEKTTPKFERAKAISYGDKAMVYISGTAAIRGEESLREADIARQTIMTCENIEYLISAANLRQSGMPAQEDAALSHLRIYLKHPHDRPAVEQILKERYGPLPIIYMEADICRDELLIEMEGTTYFQIFNKI